MHAYLVTGASAAKRQEAAEKLIKKNSIGELIRLPSPEGKHQIKVIRELNQKLSLRPPAQRGVLVEDAQLLTQEAANSFLKTLEEPPRDTIIILTAPARELVLETISSRTAHIDLGAPVNEISKGEQEEHEKILRGLLKAGVGERFSVAEEYSRSREEGTDFVIGQTFAARELLFNRLNRPLQSIEVLQVVELLERLEQTRQDLEANVNVKLTIYDLLLHYPQST